MRTFALSAAALLVACASAPNGSTSRAPTDRTTRVIDGAGRSTAITTTTEIGSAVTRVAAPMEKAWPALRAAYDSLGIPVATVDEAGHIIGNAGFKLRRRLGAIPLSRLLDCGAAQGVPNAESYDVLLAVATVLTPESGSGTVATTTVQASAKPIAFAGDYVACSSTGALEARIGVLLEGMVRG